MSTTTSSARRGWTTRPPATRVWKPCWTSTPAEYLPVLALFDHEEVGSTSDHGADSELLLTTLERIVLAGGGGREDFLRRMSGSMVASADMAHATHPNYPERHEPGHLIAVNGGPVLKVHPNLRYATDGRTAAAFALACRQAGVPLQRYEHRADLPCGSTIGPMTAARTGIADGRRRRPSARDALGTRTDGRQRRSRLRGGAAGVPVARLTVRRRPGRSGSRSPRRCRRGCEPGPARGSRWARPARWRARRSAGRTAPRPRRGRQRWRCRRASSFRSGATASRSAIFWVYAWNPRTGSCRRASSR